jgi:hypothetical protein
MHATIYLDAERGKLDEAGRFSAAQSGSSIFSGVFPFVLLISAVG